MIGAAAPGLWYRPRGNAGAFGAAVVAAEEAAIRHAERRRDRRQNALVDGLAGLEPADRARHDGGFRCQVGGAVAACDAEAEDARR